MGTPLVYLLLVWGLFTAALIALITYRSFLESREDDQIFIAKVTRLGGPIKALSFASGGLLAVCAGVWIWDGLASF